MIVSPIKCDLLAIERGKTDICIVIVIKTKHMQVVSDLTGKIKYSDIKIEKNLSKLRVVISYPYVAPAQIGGIGPLVSDPNGMNVRKLRDLFSGKAGRISMQLIHGGQTQEICTNASIFTLFEFSQFHEGFIKVVKLDGDSDDAYDMFEMHGTIELTGNHQNIPIAQGAYLSISLTDMDPSAHIAMYTGETAHTSNTFYRYSKQNLGVGIDQRKFDNTTGLHLIGSIDTLNELRLSYDNSESVEQNKYEVIRDMEENNDLVMKWTLATGNQATEPDEYGIFKTYIKDISGAHSIHILGDPAAGHEYYIVEEMKMV